MLEPLMLARMRPNAVTERYTVFETALGSCGLAWSATGVTRLQLPERNRRATEERLRSGSAMVRAQVAPRAIARLIEALQSYFEGHAVDLRGVELDLDRASPFHRKVYEAARGIDWGRTSSYGRLASEVGAPGAARAVGQAMARNPVPIIIPCHRVLASGARMGGFSAYGGTLTKKRLLALEGIDLDGEAPRLPL